MQGARPRTGAGVLSAVRRVRERKRNAGGVRGTPSEARWRPDSKKLQAHAERAAQSAAAVGVFMSNSGQGYHTE